MLLSAQIGIAGSVIGVAVGSVVSTVSSQLYKKFLAGSAEKLRGFASSDNEEENAAANAVAAQNATQSSHTRKPPLCPSHAYHSRAPKPPRCLRWAQRRAHSTKRRFRRLIPPKRGVLSAGQIVGADAHDMRGSQAAQGTQSNTPRINSAAGHTGNASHATGVVEIEAQKQKDHAAPRARGFSRLVPCGNPAVREPRAYVHRWRRHRYKSNPVHRRSRNEPACRRKQRCDQQ